jgi:hypothetical protein
MTGLHRDPVKTCHLTVENADIARMSVAKKTDMGNEQNEQIAGNRDAFSVLERRAITPS